MRQEFYRSLWTGPVQNWAYGNQRKSLENRCWTKEDSQNCQEGAAEYLATQVLRASNVPSFAEYEMNAVVRNGGVVHTCTSKDFLADQNTDIANIVYAIDLLEQHYRKFDKEDNPVGWAGVYNRHTKGMSNKQLIQNFVSVIEEETGLIDFGGYFTQLCELDALLRNTDRHLKNIAVLETPQGYTYCPIFDNGSSFGAVAPPAYDSFKDPESKLFNLLKPYGLFGSNFEKVTEACHELYGSRLQVLSSLNLEPAFQRISEVYDHITASKMRTIWLRSKGLHSELFVEKLTQLPFGELSMQR